MSVFLAGLFILALTLGYVMSALYDSYYIPIEMFNYMLRDFPVYI